MLQVTYKQNKESRESYAYKFCEIVEGIFLQILIFNINVTRLFQKWMPCCIHLFPRIQSHLLFCRPLIRARTLKSTTQEDWWAGQSGVSQALRRSHLMLLEKSATLSTIGFEGNGADDVEKLLASHGKPFKNHALQQQLDRLSINFCWKGRTWVSIHDHWLMSTKRPSDCTASAWLSKHHNGFIWVLYMVVKCYLSVTDKFWIPRKKSFKGKPCYSVYLHLYFMTWNYLGVLGYQPTPHLIKIYNTPDYHWIHLRSECLLEKRFHCIKQGSLVYGKCKNKFSVMEIKFTPAPDLLREQKHIQGDRKSFKFFSCALTYSVRAMLPNRGRFY